jgi:hypothetical protein
MFHVELRQRPNVARTFNLTGEALRAQVVSKLRSGELFEYAGHEWDGRQAHVTILEGPQLAPHELLLGRGWSNAQKSGTDVTGKVLEHSQSDAGRRDAIDRLTERILGRISAQPLTLAAAVSLADDLLPGHRASERLAVAELAAWELLHRGRADLVDGSGTAIGPQEWEQLLLRWETWSGAQATASSISLARSASEENR